MADSGEPAYGPATADYIAWIKILEAEEAKGSLKELYELDDADILDLNQIAAYFADANQMVNGLGVEVAGEPLGLHPDEEREGFQHQ